MVWHEHCKASSSQVKARHERLSNHSTNLINIRRRALRPWYRSSWIYNHEYSSGLVRAFSTDRFSSVLCSLNTFLKMHLWVWLEWDWGDTIIQWTLKSLLNVIEWTLCICSATFYPGPGHAARQNYISSNNLTGTQWDIDVCIPFLCGSTFSRYVLLTFSLNLVWGIIAWVYNIPHLLNVHATTATSIWSLHALVAAWAPLFYEELALIVQFPPD